ncbi:hypothetical protein [Pseudomonas wadenswilerensis]|uniref:Uncharacterized protein n=2 Tax=Pseudomonas wadenswilerensis TaxID=1785161 RepID=A0A380T0N5_9PSED|nr:hypothetical protein [Pseudomonas wadenswilerensis]SUQ63799.1 hypothetical protein CCOS864_03252 [Pseudomonas wadenswilerensis]
MTRTPSAVFPPPPAMTATSGTLQPGFYIVPHSMTGAQVLALLTAQQGPQLIARLQRLNPTFASGFKAGEIFVVGDPDITSACTREEAELMTAAAQVRESLAALSAEEANFMMRHQAEIAGLSAGASQAMGVGKDMLEKGLRQVEATLRSIEQLHQLSALPNSLRLQNQTPNFGNASLRSRWYLVNTVSGAMLYPRFCIRKGLFDAGELQVFPAYLKRKMIISSWLSIIGFAWLMTGAGLLKLSNG